MFNPFFLYVISFSVAILLYSLGFSEIYPSLSGGIILYFIITFIIAAYLGVKISKKNEMKYYEVKYNKFLVYITIAILVGFTMEFIYAGQVPLFSSEAYIGFEGIPTFHVLIYTFTIFFSVYLFHVLISTKMKRVAILFGLTLVPSFLLVSRGMLVNIAIGSFFVFTYKIGKNLKFYKKHVLKIVILGFVGMFLFGLSGNLRNNKLNNNTNKFDNSYILDVGKASDSFKNSIIPKEFFWGYLYVSSPLANLQKVIDTSNPEITTENFERFLSNELVMDFLSKRIFKENYNSPKEMQLIAPTLTVGTAFRGAYYYLGWLGMGLFFCALMGATYMYISLLSKENPFKLVGIAMITNLIALCIFDNMIAFSGMSFQLVFPLIWEAVIRYKKIKAKRETKLENKDIDESESNKLGCKVGG